MPLFPETPRLPFDLLSLSCRLRFPPQQAELPGLVLFALFTLKRYRMRERQDRALDPPRIDGVRRSASARDVPPGHGHSRVIIDHPDLHSVQLRLRVYQDHQGISEGVQERARKAQSRVEKDFVPTPSRDCHNGKVIMLNLFHII